MKKEILYYTSNREKPEFEQKIVAKLKETTNLPIISVSQKPMDLGRNICVGDVGLSYLNLYRQQLIGARESNADWLVFAESDFIYPPEYFDFEPTEDCYLYDNIYILFHQKINSFRKKDGSHGAQYIRRTSLIDRLEKGLEGMPEWYDGNPSPWRDKKHEHFVALPEHTTFYGKIPAISFKTGDGVNEWTGVVRKSSVQELPYWGSADDLRKEFLW